jgi:hypothetical protein
VVLDCNAISTIKGFSVLSNVILNKQCNKNALYMQVYSICNFRRNQMLCYVSYKETHCVFPESGAFVCRTFIDYGMLKKRLNPSILGFEVTNTITGFAARNI